MLLVDTNIIVDILESDASWFEWSARQLRAQRQVHELVINPVIYAELAPATDSEGELEALIGDLEVVFRELPRPALYLAGIVHRFYRRAGGTRQAVLSDFFIGAHAAVMGCGILTRDPRRYRQYFPRVPLVTP